jgi:hypothetical protein
MKKIALILGLFLVLNSNTFAKTDNNAQIHVSTKIGEQKFVNPIFYQPLRPLSSTTGWAYLTPTSVTFSTLSDKNKITNKGKCSLIENKQDRITLKCDFSWYDPKGNSDIKQYYFTFLTKGYFFDTHIKIQELNYQIKNGQVDKMSSEFYITPIDKVSLKSD